MPLTVLDYTAQENLGGLACSKITLIPISDIINQTATTITYQNAYEIYFTDGTAVHTERQKRTAQGVFFEQNIDFIVPKRRQDIRNFLTESANKYFYIQYTDANGYTVDLPIMQLSTDSTTGRQVRERNETAFKLEGITRVPARAGKDIVLYIKKQYGLFADGINDSVTVPYIDFSTTTSTAYTATFVISGIKIYPTFATAKLYSNYYPAGNGVLFEAFRIGNDLHCLFYANIVAGAYIYANFVIPNYDFTKKLTSLYFIKPATALAADLRLWVDGIAYTPAGTIQNAVGTIGTPSAVGSIFTADSITYGTFTMFDFKVFNKSLSDTEMTELYTTGEIPATALANVLLWYEFESLYLDAGFTKTADKSGGARHGILNGYASGQQAIIDEDGNNVQLAP